MRRGRNCGKKVFTWNLADGSGVEHRIHVYMKEERELIIFTAICDDPPFQIQSDHTTKLRQEAKVRLMEVRPLQWTPYAYIIIDDDDDDDDYLAEENYHYFREECRRWDDKKIVGRAAVEIKRIDVATDGKNQFMPDNNNRAKPEPFDKDNLDTKLEHTLQELTPETFRVYQNLVETVKLFRASLAKALDVKHFEKTCAALKKGPLTPTQLVELLRSKK